MNSKITHNDKNKTRMEELLKILRHQYPDKYEELHEQTAKVICDLLGVIVKSLKSDNMEKLDFMIDNLLQNRPLYKDSGLWQQRSDDMEEVLYQQDANETFYQFIERIFQNENEFKDAFKPD